MVELSDKEKWQALMRGQVISATVSKFMTIIRLLDQKAQVMIFLNSILVPVCIRAAENHVFKDAAILSIVTAILSILAAIVCIYPKRMYRKVSDENLNLLHFNDIGHIERDDYMEMFLPIFNDPEKLSNAVIHDIYDTSRYAILPKYMWLKVSYALFAIGNLLSIIIVLIEVR